MSKTIFRAHHRPHCSATEASCGSGVPLLLLPKCLGATLRHAARALRQRKTESSPRSLQHCMALIDQDNLCLIGRKVLESTLLPQHSGRITEGARHFRSGRARPHSDKNGYPLYSLRGAEVLRSRIIAVLEAADRDPSRVDQGALNGHRHTSHPSQEVGPFRRPQ